MGRNRTDLINEPVDSADFSEWESSADTFCILTKGSQFFEGTSQALKAEHGKCVTVTVKVNEIGEQQPENGNQEQFSAGQT